MTDSEKKNNPRKNRASAVTAAAQNETTQNETVTAGTQETIGRQASLETMSTAGTDSRFEPNLEVPSKSSPKGTRKSIAKEVAKSTAKKTAKTPTVANDARAVSSTSKAVATTDKIKRALRIIVGVIIALLIAAIAWFCAAHWWLYDDAADIQGTWTIEGTEKTLTITATEIALTEDVSYEYEINPLTKTITFTFGSYEGQGYYRFSLDHNQLCIVDGESNWLINLIDDIGWTFTATFEQISGAQLSPELGQDNQTNLIR